MSGRLVEQSRPQEDRAMIGKPGDPTKTFVAFFTLLELVCGLDATVADSEF